MEIGWKRILVCAAAALALPAAGWAGDLAEASAGLDMGTVYVKPAVYLIGPIASCGKVRLPEMENSQAVYGCPTSVLYVPAHYDPIPKENWRLTGSTRLLCEFRDYECIAHILLGFIPIPLSYECIRNAEVRQGPSYVVSWDAEPYLRAEPTAAASPARN